MTRSKTLIALALLATTATAAQAGDWTNSGMYNGYGANMNQTSGYSLRDGNGNLTMVDGRPVSAQYSQGSGAQYAGGGVGMGYSIHAGMVIVADGSDMMAERLERVLTSDPGMGVVRHADAGYEEAIGFAKKSGVKIPGLTY